MRTTVLFSSEDTLFLGLFYLFVGALVWWHGYGWLCGRIQTPETADDTYAARRRRLRLGFYAFLGSRFPTRAMGLVRIVVGAIAIALGLLAVYEGLYWRAMGWTGPA